MADLVIDETIEAIVLPNGEELTLGGGEPTLQSKTLNVSSAGTTTVTPDSGYDGLDEVEINVPEADPHIGVEAGFYTENNVRKWRLRGKAVVYDDDGYSEGYIGQGDYYGDWVVRNAVPSNTTITPTESSQTIGGADTMMERAVTVAAIPSNYVGSGITQRSSSDLTASGATVSAPSGYYASNASKAVASGTEGTPTATKGTVSNHSVSVTPSVTNSAGYISGGTKTGTAVSVSASELVSGTVNITSSGNTDVTNYATATVAAGSATASATKGTVSNHSVTVTPSVTRTAGYVTAGSANGTAVTVSASELVSGSQTVTQNGTVDVTNLAEVVVDVSGGGGSSANIGSAWTQVQSASSSISFTGIQSSPTSFAVYYSDNGATIATGTPAKVAAVVYDGTSLMAQTVTTQATFDNSSFSQSYSNGTLTITSSSANFVAGYYDIVYSYGGSAANVKTQEVQVGSGATSITFTGVEPSDYYSVIFKSDFGTSSGYQRVMFVTHHQAFSGICLDSQAHVSSDYWTGSLNNGNLTITSQGTNAGGYFHQPGYYQLTYVTADASPYQSKTVTPTTSQQVVTADEGYDALSQVTVNAIPNTYVQPTSTVGSTTYRASTSNQTIASGTYHSAAATIAAVSQTNLTAANIKSGTTISISNGQSNLWSVTGTYEGGGGGSLTVATKTLTNTAVSQTLSFTSLSGQPKYWFLRVTSQVSSSGSTTYYYITDLFYDGTNITGNTFRIGSTRRIYNITSGISQSYSNGTLTITGGSAAGSTPGQFYGASGIGYELIYIY